MNSSLIIFLLFTILFSSANVYAELLIELDNETVYSTDDPVFITAKLDYIPQDNFVMVQIFDSRGNAAYVRYTPVDPNGYLCGFVIPDAQKNIFPNCINLFVGKSNTPLDEGIYEIKVTGRNNNEIVTDSNFFTLHIIQQSQNSSETTDTQNGGGCLIATATFNSELSPQVQNLREIRDNVVLKTESGRLFMTSFNYIYYSFSPTISDLERENRFLKEIIKIGITPLLSTLSLLNIDPHISEHELIFYGVILIGMNIMIYFLIPSFLILKLKKYIINRINSKNHELNK